MKAITRSARLVRNLRKSGGAGKGLKEAMLTAAKTVGVQGSPR